MRQGESKTVEHYADRFVPPAAPRQTPGVHDHATRVFRDVTEVPPIHEEISGLLAARDYSKRDVFAIELALEEALVNAVRHGNQMDPAKQVHVAYRVTDSRFEITIEDEGPGFILDEVRDPRALENLERPCGRGLFLMHHYMSDVVFHPPGNKLTMRKLRSRPHDNGQA
jgi:serine/threonine-protein kinase RsbW